MTGAAVAILGRSWESAGNHTGPGEITGPCVSLMRRVMELGAIAASFPGVARVVTASEPSCKP